jgi:hypothetical protein
MKADFSKTKRRCEAYIYNIVMHMCVYIYPLIIKLRGSLKDICRCWKIIVELLYLCLQLSIVIILCRNNYSSVSPW